MDSSSLLLKPKNNNSNLTMSSASSYSNLSPPSASSLPIGSWLMSRGKSILCILFSFVFLSSFFVYSYWATEEGRGMPGEFAQTEPESTTTTTTTNLDPETSTFFSVLLDAGSSGTRLQLYSYRFPSAGSGKSFSDTLPQINPANSDNWQKKITPGLSTFGTALPEDIEAYLQPLMEFAQSHLPAHVHSQTPLYLYATAGMRLLPMNQQVHVLQHTCAALKRLSPFAISDCRDQVKIITGEIEGLYGWLTVNYLLKGFQRKNLFADDANTKTVSVSPSMKDLIPYGSTFGFMDMGGASAQIAYVPATGDLQEHMEDLFNVTLINSSGESITYHIFVTTFLGYGANEARRRYIAHLIPESTPSTTPVTDPCLPKGLERQVEHPTLSGSQMKLVGSGDFKSCLKNTLPLLNKTAPCPNPPCLFSGQHTPGFRADLGRGFIGVSELWYTTHNVAMDVGNDLTPGEIEEQSNEFCEKNWNDILTQYKDKEQPDRLESQCFKAAWVMAVLKYGLNLKDDETSPKTPDQPVVQDPQKPIFQPADEIKGISVSWTLGATLLHSIQAFRDKILAKRRALGKLTNTSDWTFSQSVAVFILGLTVAGGLTIVFIQWIKRRRSRYGGVQAWLRQRQNAFRSINTNTNTIHDVEAARGPSLSISPLGMKSITTLRSSTPPIPYSSAIRQHSSNTGSSNRF